MSASLRSRRPARRILRGVLALLAVLVVVTGWSLGHALTAPGGGTVSERVAEWARGHSLGPLVTLGEWITYQPPKVGGKPSFALTGPSAAAARHGSGSGGRPGSGGRLSGPGRPGQGRPNGSASQLIPHRLTSPAGKGLHGEGAWRILGTVHGLPAIFGTYLRPDKLHTSYVAGIVSMNQNLLRRNGPIVCSKVYLIFLDGR